MIKYKSVMTSIRPIKAGIPQESVLGLLLYLIFTADIPQQVGVTLATYVDNTAILALHSKTTIASNINQKYLETL